MYGIEFSQLKSKAKKIWRLYRLPLPPSYTFSAHIDLLTNRVHPIKITEVAAYIRVCVVYLYKYLHIYFIYTVKEINEHFQVETKLK